ncbi:arsenic resistance protein [Saccharomonospora sp. CUA-673]|uniref:arsenic resistance protein n=1 Tax=Saccharomonospora sp. CUA-673 TaxID=1904969 RepID=UPI00095C949E|nr:bile acid:sodium symporter [Saccharomonospora sp. CUA-673]OLT47070.1 arsenic resistance protein [Saccharomonospora sp. CUA-673]
MSGPVQWMERHQVPLYLAGLALGAAVGLSWEGAAAPAEAAILPVLALLLYATFLGIPFGGMGRALRDWRFLTTVSVLNFLVVPIVVWLLSRIVAHDRVLLIGVLFVLLTPCIDYVIVFAGLAGGDSERLLVAAPLLMFAQMVLLPVYLWLFVGAEFVDTVEFGPFVEAFVVMIALPLAAAAVTQFAAARTRAGRVWQRLVLEAMVPLMVATLAVVVASQIAGVGARLGSLLLVVPVYVLFAVVMTVLGAAAGRVGGFDVAGRRAVLFSGATRNSLVVLPLVLALPAAFDLAPLVVVTQTLVELVVMVVFVRLVPRLLRERTDHAPSG